MDGELNIMDARSVMLCHAVCSFVEMAGRFWKHAMFCGKELALALMRA
jgi:hypothetical protein